MSKVKDWDEIEREFKEVNSMSCKPNFPKLSKNYVTDENQSVKWNREQVELNNQNYQKAVVELNTQKNKARDNVLNDIYKRIQYQVGHNLSTKAAIKIWNHAYEEGRDDGFAYIKCCVDELIDLVSEILTAQDLENKA